MKDEQFAALMRVLERIADVSERATDINERVLGHWDIRERVDEEQRQRRLIADEIDIEQRRAAVAVWDAQARSR